MKKYKLSASVLAAVLTVGTWMLVGVLLVMELWEMDLTRMRRYRDEEQLRANVEAGFLLYALDSTLRERWAPDSTFLLFEDRETSGVHFVCWRWGMYEVVTVTAGGGRKSSTRLMGKAWESDRRATLYVPGDSRSFSLTGRSWVNGRLYIPRKGIAYTQVRSEFFSGIRVKEEQLRVSDEDFPPMDGEARTTVDQLLAMGRGSEMPENGSTLKRDFSRDVLEAEVGEYLAGTNIRGQVILYSPDVVFLEQDNRLEDVIVVGRKVEIADGFTGSLQVFARDTILLGDRVVLKPGSGLYVKQQEAGCLLRLGEHCEVNGYVVVESLPTDGEQRRAVYFQPETSGVRGLVYVDGIAEVHGCVTGSLYARHCYYFAPEGYYADMLYNAVLPGNAGVDYPLLMAGPYERKEVKWLH